jgi:hypothetical protein
MTQDRTRAKPGEPYDPSVLSEDEKERLLAALGDGFGYSHQSQRLDEAALPAEVEPGLLTHRAYYFRPSEY